MDTITGQMCHLVFLLPNGNQNMKNRRSCDAKEPVMLPNITYVSSFVHIDIRLCGQPTKKGHNLVGLCPSPFALLLAIPSKQDAVLKYDDCPCHNQHELPMLLPEPFNHAPFCYHLFTPQSRVLLPRGHLWPWA